MALGFYKIQGWPSWSAVLTISDSSVKQILEIDPSKVIKLEKVISLAFLCIQGEAMK